jgi:hypothetical protein
MTLNTFTPETITYTGFGQQMLGPIWVFFDLFSQLSYKDSQIL